MDSKKLQKLKDDLPILKMEMNQAWRTGDDLRVQKTRHYWNTRILISIFWKPVSLLEIKEMR
jgi:hypothetical protein